MNNLKQLIKDSGRTNAWIKDEMRKHGIEMNGRKLRRIKNNEQQPTAREIDVFETLFGWSYSEIYK